MNENHKQQQHGGKRGVGRNRSIDAPHTSCGAERATSLPHDWRERMPDPASYYSRHVARLGKPNVRGWAQGHCPFHDDHNASLSVHIGDTRGGWRCFAGCGGGDLVGFEMKRRGQSFQDAVASLLRGGA